jgi:hypothetical protein
MKRRGRLPASSECATRSPFFAVLLADVVGRIALQIVGDEQRGDESRSPCRLYIVESANWLHARGHVEKAEQLHAALPAVQHLGV